jgi:hypothetical protein
MGYFNYSIVLLTIFSVLVAYKLTHLKDKYFNDIKVDQFLALTENLTSAEEFNAFCTEHSDFCVPAFKPLNEKFVRKFVTVPEYKMAACIMPKCASTQVHL